MHAQRSLPEDPRLRDVAERLENTRAVVELYDSQWRLVWVSDEIKEMLDEYNEDTLGIGKHMIEAVCLNETWFRKINPESFFELALLLTPLQISDTPGGKDEVFEKAWRAMSLWDPPVQISKEDVRGFFDQLEPVTPPPVFSASFSFTAEGKLPERVEYFGIRLHDKNKEFFGTIFFTTPALPASLVSLLARGNVGMFERMAQLFEPGRRQAAILFADLHASGKLSRRLPSASYFQLISSLTTEIDRVIAEHRGVVGKHAGDGVSAFFLVEEFGSPSATARAAIEASRAVGDVAERVAKQVMGETGAINGGDVAVNVGLHWGATLYIGQLVTGGRLEVTALGDEVNECARIQEAAQDGQVLASKDLIEHLSADDAVGLGLDPGVMRYLMIAEVPGAPEKAVQDAGSLAVTTL
jgi:class 3 adenylate cyclase